MASAFGGQRSIQLSYGCLGAAIAMVPVICKQHFVRAASRSRCRKYPLLKATQNQQVGRQIR